MTVRAVAGLLLLLAPRTSSAQNRSNAVLYLSPVPGSKMVSQESNIIIGMQHRLDRTLIGSPSLFTVRGTVSGDHAGITDLSDDETKLIFVPLRPFFPGETVTVKLGDGSANGELNKFAPVGFQFSVSATSALERRVLQEKIDAAYLPHPTNSPVPKPPTRSPLNTLKVDSIPSDLPSRLVVKTNNPSSGCLFLGSFKIAEAGDHLQFISLVPSNSQYLMILDNSGKPVFQKKMPSLSSDFKMQPNGYLTYYDQGADAYYELDSSYAVIDSFRTANGYTTDLHELIVLPNGHVLMLAHDPETIDMSKVVPGGYPYATVIGAVIQEFDQKRNVIFQWRSFDHFQITDATHEDMTAQTIDAVHPNTIEVDNDNNLLLSSRHMDEITKIDRTTGAIIWRWGGKNNQFSYLSDSIAFSHQHTIRRTSSGSLILFDNGNYGAKPFSRAVEYSMDERAKTVKLLWQFRHSPDVDAIAMGSVQRLSNGNTLIGWGTASPAITEVRPDGTTALEIQLPDSIVSYRAFRFQWKQPAVTTGVREVGDIATMFSLSQNYPNPFNPSTVIRFGLPEAAHVSLKVYDMTGRTVATLLDGTRAAGSYSVEFNASRLASGAYIYRLTTPQKSISRVMTLLK